MLDRPIDPSRPFTAEAYAALPEQRDVEIAELDPIPAAEPFAHEGVEREPYLPDAELVEAVNVAIALGRPLLLQGDPGCGKTRLAYALAYALGVPLEACYIKSTSRAQDMLYIFDAIGRLYDTQLGAEGPRDPSNLSQPKCRNPRNYVRFAPLGRAIVRSQLGRRSVVLLDEIDKADLDFPNDLLRELDRMEFEVSEVPGLRYAARRDPNVRPILIVTHNEEKALPAAFLRRCVFHVVRFPQSATQLREILDMHTQASPALAEKAVEILLRLREGDYDKKPGTSELIDWVTYHSAKGTEAAVLDALPAMGALLKLQTDHERARREWPGLKSI